MQVTLTKLMNDNLRLKGEGVQDFAKAMRGLDLNDKKWYARQFVIQGMATAVEVTEPIEGGNYVKHTVTL